MLSENTVFHSVPGITSKKGTEPNDLLLGGDFKHL